MFINMLNTIYNIEYKYKYIGETLRPPCEIVVKTYLPQIRARIAKRLIEEYNWKPSEVAKVLSMSSTAVLKYKRILNMETGLNRDFLENISDKLCKIIISSKNIDPEIFIKNICLNCMYARINGTICSIHRKTYPYLSSCTVCSQIFSKISGLSVEMSQVIYSLKEALKIVKGIKYFYKLIPEVRTNIVMALKNAKNISEVAGFPGRITVIRNNIYAYHEPEFGASKHLASILLKIREKNRNILSCTCIKYMPNIEKVLMKSGFKIHYMDRNKFSNIEEFIDGLKEFRENDVIIDLGGKGIEPVVYIFGLNAIDLAKRLSIISRYQHVK